ncbi:MAG: NRDE family protein [Proteobacteria bacterium]|nr:NRDE family protein [Pseudomonadota bacterium]
MCLILLAWQAHPSYPLVIAANRDEFFARPTATADFWDDAPNILAGRDLSAGGTWMGITRQGRFAALTNFREPGKNQSQAPSRGKLVSDFLAGAMPASAYLDELSPRTAAFNGFNLVCGSLNEGLWHFSNRSAGGKPHRLAAGIYGLSNHLLDTPWPKVAQGKSDLAKALAALPQDKPLFELLRDENIHEDDQLPRTGVSLEWERILSAAFVETSNYGTRSSTVLHLDGLRFLSFDEQIWLPGGLPGNRRRFHFKLEDSASL